MKSEISHLSKAIEKSRESKRAGLFPAGAVIVEKGTVISESVSDAYPGYSHAEYSAIDEAFMKLKKPLKNVTLYSSMEPCLMCLAKAYNAGIRKIVFAISRLSVPTDYYEGANNNAEIISNFNEDLEFFHIVALEQEALKIVNE